MKDGKPEPVQVQHNWLWVIIPFDTGNLPLLSGYCKNCQATWTEILPHPWQSQGEWRNSILGKSKMPKWGCIVPDGF